MKPAFQSILQSQRANQYSKESLEIAKWAALVSFRQDCESRAAAAAPMATSCVAAIGLPLPPPPYVNTKANATIHVLARRSVDLMNEVREQHHNAMSIAASPFLSIILYGIAILPLEHRYTLRGWRVLRRKSLLFGMVSQAIFAYQAPVAAAFIAYAFFFAGVWERSRRRSKQS